MAKACSNEMPIGILGANALAIPLLLLLLFIVLIVCRKVSAQIDTLESNVCAVWDVAMRYACPPPIAREINNSGLSFAQKTPHQPESAAK